MKESIIGVEVLLAVCCVFNLIVLCVHTGCSQKRWPGFGAWIDGCRSILTVPWRRRICYSPEVRMLTQTAVHSNPSKLWWVRIYLKGFYLKALVLKTPNPEGDGVTDETSSQILVPNDILVFDHPTTNCGHLRQSHTSCWTASLWSLIDINDTYLNWFHKFYKKQIFGDEVQSHCPETN